MSSTEFHDPWRALKLSDSEEGSRDFDPVTASEVPDARSSFCARLLSCIPLFIPLPIALPDDQMSPFQALVPLPNPDPNALLAARGCSLLDVPVPNPNGPSLLFLVCIDVIIQLYIGLILVCGRRI